MIGQAGIPNAVVIGGFRQQINKLKEPLALGVQRECKFLSPSFYPTRDYMQRLDVGETYSISANPPSGNGDDALRNRSF